jgi:hypothetical protein
MVVKLLQFTIPCYSIRWSLQYKLYGGKITSIYDTASFYSLKSLIQTVLHANKICLKSADIRIGVHRKACLKEANMDHTRPMTHDRLSAEQSWCIYDPWQIEVHRKFCLCRKPWPSSRRHGKVGTGILHIWTCGPSSGYGNSQEAKVKHKITSGF